MATDVVVVGGGVTGTGVARDLALRGVDVTLFERGPLAAGTSGRMHGLLHSGARYAVTDPASARDCITENRVLRDIAAHCLVDTGGLYCVLPGDDRGYVERQRAACEACGIPVDPLTGEAARALEPGLSADVERALSVPDAVVDPFRLTAATAAGAAAAGAEIRTGVGVTDIRRAGDRVAGVEFTRGDRARTESVRAAHVVNAAGAWAGRVAALAGATVDLRLSRGAMTIVEPRTVETVAHRCRPRSEGDIAVPCGSATVLGTTDVPVEDPDTAEPDPAAAGFLVESLATLVPAVADAAIVRTFAGIRPLAAPRAQDPGHPGESASATRDFRVLRHSTRDGIHGLTSVVGGKLTTHRLMAERVADAVCAELGVDEPCRTADTPVAGADDESVLIDALERFGIADGLETAPW